ncbi:MAG: sigma-70 family RNA polymerase sigma factor [Clostridia bacterium]|nr:sigma-70 family RNA polymerase sigma factor [Clostridia bacterium]
MLNENDCLILVRSAKQGDNEAKERLLTECSCLMKSIVRRFLGKGTEYNDLYQLASIGLLKAIDGFKEDFGAKFTTYAVPMIAGEIKRFLRDDGSVKVSRAIKQQTRALNAFIERYTQEHGKAPTMQALSEEFSMEESEIVFLLDSAKMPISLYFQGDYKDEESGELLDRLPSKDFQDEWIEKLELKEAIDALSEREKKIILLGYYRDMTQSEVAREIGVSQVQISRIESKILREFKDLL